MPLDLSEAEAPECTEFASKQSSRSSNSISVEECAESGTELLSIQDILCRNKNMTKYFSLLNRCDAESGDHQKE